MEDSMEIRLGQTVQGIDGKIGDISGMVLNSRTHLVESVVVRGGGGLLQAPIDRVLPLGYVIGQDDGDLKADLDHAGFDQMAEFTRADAEPSTSYVAPASASGLGQSDSDFQALATIDTGTGTTVPSKAGGFPDVEPSIPADATYPVFRQGLDVFDAEGERIGKITDLVVDHTTAMPTVIRVRGDGLFADEADVQVAWLEDITAEGVVLSVSRATLFNKAA
jgi:sporulation protein YlmC with PRC-barrel domain